MRELSLHVLDLVENSLRAGATVVRVEVTDDSDGDRMEIVVEDNGPGLPVEPELAMDPFYTTKPGKRTGLGLSLLRFQAEQAGGGLELGRSELGGARARAVWRRSHVDRLPLGDLAASLEGVVACGDAGLELLVTLRSGGRVVRLSSTRIGRGKAAMEAAVALGERIRRGLSDLSIEEQAKEQWMATSSAPTACAEQATDRALAARLEKVLAEYRGKPGALIPVLQIAQGIYGYLPQEVIKRIAMALGKSYSEVAGVVGFYSFFSTVPRGKHLVRVCLGTACYVRGGKNVLEALKQELGVEVGGTTSDGVFSLEVARCFGACGLAPTIMIDEDVIQRVKPARVRAILDAYRSGAPASGGNGKEKQAAKKPATKSRAARKQPRKAPAKAKTTVRKVTKGGKR